VAIVTNGGGPGIMCADSCYAGGLDVVELPEDLRAHLKRITPEHGAVGNPIDMTAAATPQDYKKVIEALIAAGVCDAIITLFIPALGASPRDIAEAIDAAAAAALIPVASVLMGGTTDAGQDGPGSHGAARFRLPEDAVRALVQAVEHQRWLTRAAGVVVEPSGCRPDDAEEIVKSGLAAGAGWLPAADVVALLGCYGIPCLRTEFARTAEGAVAVATELGGRVALKASAPGLLHKSDVGGVVLDLEGPDAVSAAAQQIKESVAAAGYELDGLVVQQMAPSGAELLVGVVHDRSFGPVVACGAGGTTAEVLGDVAVRITPLTDVDAHELLRSLRTFPLLDGYRGQPRLAVEAVEDVLLRVSAMVERHPEVAEMDLNPLIVTPDGVSVSDARIRLEQPGPERPVGAL
jgi:acyl-CoA synthetase (NDP forming)